jgi:hypothetical protein
MEKTPSGTSVGVDDPYAFAGRCDFLTGDGRCRFAVERAASDPVFARERRQEGYACPIVVTDGSDPVGRGSEGDRSSGRHGVEESERGVGEHCWQECPHYRSRTRGRRCVRCGLEERRTTDPGERPLLDEHHLSYAGSAAGTTSHEITVSLCRWCHAKVHDSWARLADDVGPDPEAIAAREGRRSRELAETAFETAAKRQGDSERKE